LAAHTAIALHCYRQDTKFKYISQSITPDTGNEKVNDIIRKFNGQCYLLVSPLNVDHCPSVDFTGKKSKAKDAHFVRANSTYSGIQTLLGEASANYQLLSSTRNFTSMMGRNECDVTFIVSAMLGALAQYKKVQVEIYSTAYLEPLYSSYSKWKMTLPSESRDDYSLWFLMDQAKLTNAGAYSKFCTLTSHSDHVLVWDLGQVVSSAREYKDKHRAASALMEQIRRHRRYIVRTALYGDLVTCPDSASFTVGWEPNPNPDLPAVEVKIPNSSHYVYEFGIGYAFQGICSSEPDVAMMAQTVKGAYYLKPVKRNGGTLLDWYDYVEASATLVLAAPFRSQAYASEICNVVCTERSRFKVTRKYNGELEYATIESYTSVDIAEDFEEEDDESYESSDDDPDPVVTTQSGTGNSSATTLTVQDQSDLVLEDPHLQKRLQKKKKKEVDPDDVEEKTRSKALAAQLADDV
jgi:hypothetical protein